MEVFWSCTSVPASTFNTPPEPLATKVCPKVKEPEVTSKVELLFKAMVPLPNPWPGTPKQ